MTSGPTLDDVKARRAQIAAMRSALEAEDHELQIAERVLMRLARKTLAIAPRLPDEQISSQQIGDDGAASGTVEELIIRTLRLSAVAWLTSAEVKGDVDRMRGREVPMGTIGPVLTELKNKNIIVRDGNRVALSERSHEAHVPRHADH